MAILSTAPRAAGGGASGGSFTKYASLVALVFQNSALILIMHYSRVMPPTGDHRYFTSTVVFLNEIIKLAVALTLAMYETSKTLAPSTPATVLFEQIFNAVFTGDGWKLAIPGAFYTLQNLLQFVAVGNLDAVQFQVLFQLKILATALFSVALLRRHLGPKHWLALIVLTFGVSIVSLPSATAANSILFHDFSDHFFPRSFHELGHEVSSDISSPDPHLSRRSATYEGIDVDIPSPDPPMNYSLGVTCVLIAAVVAGLTSVYFEKILKESPSQASVWIRNIQISFYAAIAAFFGGVIWQDGSGIMEHGFFEGYNWVVWAAVFLQAFGGLVATLVIRDADNIVKNFATSISIVISFLVSVWMFNFTVTRTFLIGTSFVLLSTYLYSIPERRLRRPPPLRIASFEKPTIDSLTPRASPRLTPKLTEFSRLNSDPFEPRGQGKTSSRPSSPKHPRQGGRVSSKRED